MLGLAPRSAGRGPVPLQEALLTVKSNASMKSVKEAVVQSLWSLPHAE